MFLPLGLFALAACSTSSNSSLASSHSSSSSPREDPIVALYGIHNYQVEQGALPLDLLEGVEAKDQYDTSYNIQVIENIDYQTLGNYQVRYQVLLPNSEILEETSWVRIVVNQTANEAARLALLTHLESYENAFQSQSYRVQKTSYDPARNPDSFRWILNHQMEYYPNQVKEQYHYNPEVNPQGEINYVTYSTEEGYLQFEIEGDQLRHPLSIQGLHSYSIMSLFPTVPSSLYAITEQGIRMDTSYAMIAPYRNQSSLLGAIASEYSYDLQNSSGQVTIHFDCSEANVLKVTARFYNPSTQWHYQLNFQIDYHVSPAYDLSTLSQVEADSLEEVKVALQEGVDHVMTYSYTRTRYYKIQVSAGKAYQVTSNFFHNPTFFNAEHQSIPLSIHTHSLVSGLLQWFEAPMDGDLYIGLIRGNSYAFQETLTFRFDCLPQTPSMTSVTLTESTGQYVATDVSFLEGMILEFPVIQDQYYSISISSDDYYLDMNYGSYQDANNHYYIRNPSQPLFRIALFSNMTITWEIANIE
jgi:hypothetical protein